MSTINPDFIPASRKIKPPDYYLDGLYSHNRFILSETITLLESNNPKKIALAEKILNAIPVNNSNSIRIGVTGSPGVGKSTFIEAFGLYLIKNNHRPAILAIDPSSQFSKGSILGDKTRMMKLSTMEEAYIRPTPSGLILGGTSAYTKESIRVCEAAGFDYIIVETVGVGQSETEVGNITDVNLLLLQPGAGDDMQGIKRGIIENADIFIINKADGSQLHLAEQTKIAYSNAINLFHHRVNGWICPVILTSSLENKGMDEIYQAILAYIHELKEQNLFNTQRQEQEVKWFERQTFSKMQQLVFQNKNILNTFQSLCQALKNQNMNTSAALKKMNDALSVLLKN